jgi:hypothetical protein
MAECSEKYICTKDKLYILGYKHSWEIDDDQCVSVIMRIKSGDVVEPNKKGYLKIDGLFICHKDSIFSRKYFQKNSLL